MLAVALGSLVRPAVPPVVRIGLVVATALFVLAGECRLHRVTLPHRRAQVPSAVIGTGEQAGALQFGFEMGTGVLINVVGPEEAAAELRASAHAAA